MKCRSYSLHARGKPFRACRITNRKALGKAFVNDVTLKSHFLEEERVFVTLVPFFLHDIIYVFYVPEIAKFAKLINFRCDWRLLQNLLLLPLLTVSNLTKNIRELHTRSCTFGYKVNTI